MRSWQTRANMLWTRKERFRARKAACQEQQQINDVLSVANEGRLLALRSPQNQPRAGAKVVERALVTRSIPGNFRSRLLSWPPATFRRCIFQLFGSVWVEHHQRGDFRPLSIGPPPLLESPLLGRLGTFRAFMRTGSQGHFFLHAHTLSFARPSPCATRVHSRNERKSRQAPWLSPAR